MMSNAASRIDDIERRPIMVIEGSPYREIIVDRDWIKDPHVFRLSADIVDVSLEREFGRVHADHHQSFILVFLSPGADIRKRAQPIDTRVRPDVDEDNLPTQSGRRQWLRVEPPGREAERRQLTCL